MGTTCTKIHTIDLNNNGVSDFQEIVDALTEQVMAQIMPRLKIEETEEETGGT